MLIVSNLLLLIVSNRALVMSYREPIMLIVFRPLQNGRGRKAEIGQFRKNQNWFTRIIVPMCCKRQTRASGYGRRQARLIPPELLLYAEYGLEKSYGGRSPPKKN